MSLSNSKINDLAGHLNISKLEIDRLATRWPVMKDLVEGNIIPSSGIQASDITRCYEWGYSEALSDLLSATAGAAQTVGLISADDMDLLYATLHDKLSNTGQRFADAFMTDLHKDIISIRNVYDAGNDEAWMSVSSNQQGVVLFKKLMNKVIARCERVINEAGLKPDSDILHIK